MNAPANINADLGNIAIEQELLGAVLITNSAFDVIERLVSAEHFYERLNGQLFEAFARVRLIRAMRGKDFDRDDPVQTGIASAVNLSHPTCAQQDRNLIRPQSSASCEWHE